MEQALVRVVRLSAFILGSFYFQSLYIQQVGFGGNLTSTLLIGPIFGTVVLLWHAKSLRDLVNIRAAGFLIAASLIYPMVIMVFFAGQFAGEGVAIVGLVAGTVGLGVMHAILLHAAWKRTLMMIVGVLGCWLVFAALLNVENIDSPINQFVFPVTLWQGLYVLFMFSPWPSVEARPNSLAQ